MKGSTCSTPFRGAGTLLVRGVSEAGFGQESKHSWNRQGCVPEKQGAPEPRVSLLFHPVCPLPLMAHAGSTPTTLCSQALRMILQTPLRPTQHWAQEAEPSVPWLLMPALEAPAGILSPNPTVTIFSLPPRPQKPSHSPQSMTGITN